MTRLADTEEIGLDPGTEPFGPGTIVGLYAVQPCSMGSESYEPFEARILDSPEPGYYIGELPDGTLVDFSARNVAWVGPSMGGVWDWLKKSFKGAVPTVTPPTHGLPAYPPAKLPALPSAPKRSFFEYFRPKAPEEVPTGPLVPRPEMMPEKYVREPGIMEYFKPDAPGILARIKEGIKALMPAKVLEQIKPSPVFEETRQLQLWSDIFPPTQPGTSWIQQMTPFQETEVQPEEQIQAPSREMLEDAKILPLPPRNTLLPTAYDVARGLLAFFDPIEEKIWDHIRGIRQEEWFQEEVSRGDEGGVYPFESIGLCQQHPDVYEGLAMFFHIPWDAIVEMAGPMDVEDEEGNKYVELTEFEAVTEEIVWPAIQLIEDAFELIKPPDLPGFFTMKWNEHGCMLDISYVEGVPEHSLDPGPSAYVPPQVEEPEEEEEPPPPKAKKKSRKK